MLQNLFSFGDKLSNINLKINNNVLEVKKNILNNYIIYGNWL